MKKLVSVFMAMIMAITVGTTFVSANSLTSVNGGISTFNLYTNTVSANCMINSNGSIYYSAQVNAKSNATKISVYVYLYQYVDGAWKKLQGFTERVDDTYLFASKTYSSAVSGGKYRCTVHAYVYGADGNDRIEISSSTIVAS